MSPWLATYLLGVVTGLGLAALGWLLRMLWPTRPEERIQWPRPPRS